MKSFYEMLKILENEEVKTPAGYILNPEEQEDYEREKSPMYKALFLKDIDAKRKAADPGSIATREKGQVEITAEEEEKRRRQNDPDYILKILGVIVSYIEKSEGICKTFLNGVAVGLGIKDGNKWKWKKTEQEIPPYNEKVEKPKTYQGEDFLIKATELLFFALKDSEKYGGCEIISDALYKLGAKPYLKIGDIVNFDGRHHETKDGVVSNEKVVVSKPGLTNSLGHLLKKASVKAIV